MLRKLVIAGLLFMTTLAAENRVYELRTYYTIPGRLDALLARFRDHTTSLFEKHGMVNVGYWIPKDKPNTLIYLLSHKDAAAAKKSWDDFRNDPDWVKARTASEASGKIVDKVESVYLDPTDFSKMK
jgi:hypothetical protein